MVPVELVLPNDPRTGNRKKVIKYVVEGNGCWRCVSHAVGTHGYPEIRPSHKRLVTVPRFVLECLKGPLGEGHLVRHLCGNKLCINPDHLVEGTYSENNFDAVRMGTWNPKRTRGNYKYSWDTVKEVRRSYKKGTTPSVLCAKFGIPRGSIWGILNISTRRYA